jgi:hypothetical protein
MMRSLTSEWTFLKEIVLPAYESKEGRDIYEKSLNLCTTTFPGYVQEIQGMADGSGIPFYQVTQAQAHYSANYKIHIQRILISL